MAYQIFISYRRNGGEALAYLINEKLSSLGYKVFYDIESLSAGKFNQRLLEVIDECNDVLVILPPNSLDRCINEEDWLRLEVSHAINQGKNIIPIMMNGFEWNDNIPEEMKELKNYNGVLVSFDFFEGFLSRVIKYLSNSAQILTSLETKNHILFWADFDDAIIEKIINKLELENVFIEIMDEPVEILSKNLQAVESIILLVTDCTKFSSNIHAAKRINERLVRYVREGGKLIAAHDVIYRRTKNELLQNMFGCKIINFEQISSVHYYKTEECIDMDIFSNLPNDFILHDAEICWGNVAEDVDVYFETENGIPLVFSREYGKGTCIYLNSGDFKERPPKSILKPEKNFIELLKEAILI